MKFGRKMFKRHKEVFKILEDEITSILKRKEQGY
jgi:hypothetical protein